MTSETITIEVGGDAAQLFRGASPEERKKLQELVSTWLKEFAAAQARPLKEVLEQIGTKAMERGMTPEILASIVEPDR
jgi:hypothetical protein